MMMTRRFRVAVALAGLLLFWPLALALERPHLFDVMNALAICVGSGILLCYSGAARRAFTAEKCTPGHMLVVGIVLAWLAVVIRLVIVWAWRILGNPSGMLDHVLVAFTVWLFILGGALHLTARNATGDRIPRRNIIALAICASLGALLGAAMVITTERL